MSINDMYKNTQSSFTANSLTLETQMPVNKRMGTQTVVHPHRGMLHSNEKEQTIDTPSNVHKSHRYRVRGADTLYASVHMRFKERQSEQIRVTSCTWVAYKGA